MPDNSVVNIGPECFASGDFKHISFRGENYIKQCGEFVRDLPEGGKSFCVRGVAHKEPSHQDSEGIERYFGTLLTAVDYGLNEPVPSFASDEDKRRYCLELASELHGAPGYSSRVNSAENIILTAEKFEKYLEGGAK